MVIMLNNRPEEIDAETISISDFLVLRKFSFRMRIIKLNGILISKQAYDSTYIKNGDELQMLYLMSGG